MVAGTGGNVDNQRRLMAVTRRLTHAKSQFSGIWAKWRRANAWASRVWPLCLDGFCPAGASGLNLHARALVQRARFGDREDVAVQCFKLGR